MLHVLIRHESLDSKPRVERTLVQVREEDLSLAGGAGSSHGDVEGLTPTPALLTRTSTSATWIDAARLAIDPTYIRPAVPATLAAIELRRARTI